jgi:triosephosphate isomerase
VSDHNRKPLISGNWKMNLNHFEAIQTVQKLAYLLTKDDFAAVDVSIHPPFTDIRSIQTILDADEMKLSLGAQHCHWEDKGAFTGEVSPVFLSKLAVEYVIVGHSERRELFGETDDQVAKKISSILKLHDTDRVCRGNARGAATGSNGGKGVGTGSCCTCRQVGGRRCRSRHCVRANLGDRNWHDRIGRGRTGRHRGHSG